MAERGNRKSDRGSIHSLWGIKGIAVVKKKFRRPLILHGKDPRENIVGEERRQGQSTCLLGSFRPILNYLVAGGGGAKKGSKPVLRRRVTKSYSKCRRGRQGIVSQVQFGGEPKRKRSVTTSIGAY